MWRSTFVLIGFLFPLLLAQGAEQKRVMVNLDGVTCMGGAYGLSLPQALPKVFDLGKVKSQQIYESEEWDGYTSTRKYIRFDGLALDIVTFSNDTNRYLVSHAEVSKPSWNKVSIFKIGSPVSSARKILGTASVNDPDLKAEYAGDNDGVRFETSNGRVTKVIYNCYTG